MTPNWHCRLPGHVYEGPDPDGFMTRDEVVAWLDDYVRSFDPPVRTHTRVVEARERDGGGFVLDLETPDGPDTLEADDVVVATGGYHRPIEPAFARAIDPSVTQLHSQQYRNADQLPEGGVLVVGTGQSGAQIAEDLHLEGRQVHLALGDAPRVARFHRGRDCMTWLADMGLYDTAVAQYPGGLAAREKTNHYVTGRDGGRDIDLRAFALDGMRLYGKLTDAQGTDLTFAPTLTRSLDAVRAGGVDDRSDLRERTVEVAPEVRRDRTDAHQASAGTERCAPTMHCATCSASAATPRNRPDPHVCIHGRPTKNRPGTAVTPRVCVGRPVPSNTPTRSQR